MKDGTYYINDESPELLDNVVSGFWVGVGNVAELNYSPSESGVIKLTGGFPGFYGLWTDGGKTYLDRVLWIEDVDVALSMARERGELAIWDIANNSEIRVDYAPVVV